MWDGRITRTEKKNARDEESTEEASLVRRNEISDYGSRSESKEEAAPFKGDVSQFRTLDEFLDEAYEFGASEKYCLRCTSIRFYLLVLSLCVANCSFSTTILLVSYLLADEAFDETMIQGCAWRGGLLTSAIFAGMLVGGVFSGTICDRVGRKPTLLAALAVGTIANILTAVAPDVTSLSLARFVAGFSVGATEPPLFTLMTELSPPRHRGLLVTTVASFWMIGNIYVAVAGLVIFQHLDWSWRSFVMVCAFPSLLAFLMVSAYSHESPRFLCIVRGQYPKATSIANKIGEAMGYSEDVNGDIRNATGHNKRALLEAEVMYHYPRQSSVVELKSTVCNAVFMLYRNGIGAGTTIPLQVVWFSLCYGSYCLVTWINTIFVMVELDDIYFNALMFAVANLPGNLISFLAIDSTGRMPTLISSLILSALSLVAFAWYAFQSSLGNASTAAIVLCACAFQALETITWNALDVMTGEVFPCNVRSTGIGICTATGRVGALVAQCVSGAFAATGRPVTLLLVASCSFLVATFAPCALEHGEMSRLPLTDIFGGEKTRMNEEAPA